MGWSDSDWQGAKPLNSVERVLRCLGGRCFVVHERAKRTKGWVDTEPDLIRAGRSACSADRGHHDCDVGSRRLLEEICRNLGLSPSPLSPADLTAERMFGFELILADRALARELRPLIAARQREREQVRPALAAATQATELSTETEEVGSFDAVLTVPAQSPLLSAQIGVAPTHTVRSRSGTSRL